MMRATTPALITALMLTLGGCETNPAWTTQQQAASTSLLGESRKAADQFAAMPADIRPGKKPTTIVTTLVNGENFALSSAFGRTASELLAGELAQKGFPVTEIRLRGNILVKGDQGELLLSRELKELARDHDADMVVIGTYTETAARVFVTQKLVRLADSRVVTGYNYSLVKDDDIAALLHGLSEDQKPGIQTQARQKGSANPLSPESDTGRPGSLLEAIRKYDRESRGIVK